MTTKDMREYRETDSEPTKQREGDQVLPTASTSLPIAHEEVIEDLQERLRLGISRYGQGLRPFNGRNTLQDAYDEVLDQAVYMKTLLLMQRAARETLVDQVAEVVHDWREWGGTPREAAERIVDKIRDCFTGQQAQVPDAG